MADSDQRTPVRQPRADDVPEWEVFLRESSGDPLRHAGSVTAPSADVAHEQASTLFPDASTQWLARSDRVARFSDRDLGAEYEPPATVDVDGDTDSEGGVEP
ncbi:Htur_1727 family rSAM-partnered candidate RiPP [Halobaculum rubrum]|uniref:Htur_1727 family rSAM-partnered candidate RiPP n=1 Tax=Halobaculum rubrum TaxID=2872158 RepID=UPI001CA44580|nr:Htur_1727 family rSAM-partnered candidate RiPP [Halobaculum rubrum]QZX99279.1 Htur_1727 family rSAM-partnered candidate RiPP [Halobaculum rubrum]